MPKTYIIGTLLVLVLIIGIGYLSVPSDATPTPATAERSSGSATDDLASDTNTSTESELAANGSSDSGVYTEYDPELVAASQAEHIVLTFSADWCPTCRALDADITANLDNIPPDVEIYQVNFDTATDLRRQYDVTVQHTLVVVEPDGTEVASWNGGTTLDSILARL